MTKTLLVAGGGIAGMATGLAAARAGCQATVFERAAEFSEVGAGVQLGPNVTRILQAWGLGDALKQVAAFPAGLHARSMNTGEVLATLPIKDDVQLYGGGNDGNAPHGSGGIDISFGRGWHGGNCWICCQQDEDLEFCRG